MNSYLFSLPLPIHVQRELSRLCFGLPFIEWTEEENFHILLRYLGPLNDKQLFEVEDCLIDLKFLPFSISLQGIDYVNSKGGRGSIRIFVKPQEPILKLKNTLDRTLKGLSMLSNEKAFIPCVVLGKYENLAANRLGDYLIEHSYYQSSSFEISSLSLMRIHPTPKKILYETINQYSFEE